MIRVREIRLSILNDSEDALINKLTKILNVNREDIISYEIEKRSIDSRDKNNILFVYNLDVNLKDEDKVKLGNYVSNVNETNYEVNINLSTSFVKGPSGSGIGFASSNFL